MKRYVIVGCGGRGLTMFAEPIRKKFSHCAELAGLCDLNQGRLDYCVRQLGAKIPTYTDFDRMLKETKPDVVIIAAKDSVHHEYITRALRQGCDAICEKPMTIDEQKCAEILAAEKETGRRVTVTFNYRFVPYVTRIKELLQAGVIGKVLSVDLNYQLDRDHGADYFRRWHRRKENSGGLLVHKSTHHFDMINWWLGEDPVSVFAFGALRFYGPNRPERGERCLTCGYRSACGFYFNIDAPPVFGDPFDTAELYHKVEHFDGYLRDRCVFGEDIDIEDTMTLAVRYSGGAQMSYSLNAHCVYEGWRAALNGTEGRLEAAEWHSGPYVENKQREIRIHRWKKPVETIHVPVETGGHGGGDYRLHQMLFDGPRPDPLGHMASSYAGAMSILTGVAANHSIRTGQAVRIKDLINFSPGGNIY